MNSVHRVFYWGPPVSGRASSIASVMRKLGGFEPAKFELAKPHEYVRVWPPFGSISLSYGYASGKFAPQGGAVNPLVEADVHRLTASNGLIFVADSQAARLDANIGWLSRLRRVLADRGKDLDQIPTLFQFNKRDLPDVLDTSTLQRELSTAHCAYVESSAPSDVGTVEAVELLAQLAGW